MEREIGIGGRYAIPIQYRDVTYRGIEYTVYEITKLTGDSIYFIIDKEDSERTKARSWHSCVNDTYIGSTFRTTTNERKTLHLHNFVMNRLTFDGKGATETVDHINGNGFDNRKTSFTHHKVYK